MNKRRIFWERCSTYARPVVALRVYMVKAEDEEQQVAENAYDGLGLDWERWSDLFQGC